MLIRYLSLILLCLYSLTPYAFTNHQTRYINKNGSVLILTASPTGESSGTLSGTFATAVARKDCSEIIGKQVPISGYYVGNAVAITAAFAPCNSVVSFSGNLGANNHSLELLWILSLQTTSQQKVESKMRMIGQDEFKAAPLKK